MTQATSPKKALALYERDLNLWLEDAIAQLKAGDFQNLDVENLVEELEGLANKDRREVFSRLKRLIEHTLKRCYVNMPDCFRGWQVTIVNQKIELKQLLKQSPSLKSHFSQCFDESFGAALELVRAEYPDTFFPDTWQFSRDIDAMLNVDFWE